jgi:16S rRNA C967 or C1407 C5-methylase (RsmB/RsmF family)/NOL1/NOP2/fmu family ribosome biogenesis protein
MQLPTPFIQQMQEQLGIEFDDFREALSSPAPVSIHFNIFKHQYSKENFDGVEWYNNGVYLPERPNFTLDPTFQAGAYYVQEASSMLIADAVRQLFDLDRDLKVLDLCAAPGGKSTLLASLLSENSLLVSNEVIRSRYQVLDYNLTKWGISNKITISQDAERFAGLENFFDLILVDAPCSGEGLFRKDPEAMREWSPEQVQLCSARQQRILTATVPLLKPGGKLLYSTCTYNDRENSENAQWLQDNFPLETARLEFPEDWNIRERPRGFQCYPHLLRGEGLYLSAFVKTSGDGSSKDKAGKMLPYHEPLPKGREKELSRWIKSEQTFRFFQDQKGQITAIPEDLFESVLRLSPYLRYFRMGTPVGAFKGNDLIPDPALALANILHPDAPSVAVDQSTALQFLKKESIALTTKPGWKVVRYNGLALGWIKALPNRINNYYPKEWRIRMQI